MSDNSLTNFRGDQLILIEQKNCVKCTRHMPFQTVDDSTRVVWHSLWLQRVDDVAADGGAAMGRAAAGDSRTMCFYERCAATVCKQLFSA